MATGKQQRKQLDWERIEAEYRAGKLSLREIARQHGCTDTAVRKKAKAESWSRDLTTKVDEEVRSKLVRMVRTPEATEREVIEAAAEVSAGVVLSHRKDLARLKAMEEKFMAELGDNEDGTQPTKLYITQYQGQIVKEEVGLTVAEKASTLLALANVRARRIELERKTFNIDGDRDLSEQTTDISITLIPGQGEE